jgi:hypothetical protein
MPVYLPEQRHVICWVFTEQSISALSILTRVPVSCAVTVGPPRSLFSSPPDVAPCLCGNFSDISSLRVSAHLRRFAVRTLPLFVWTVTSQFGIVSLGGVYTRFKADCCLHLRNGRKLESGLEWGVGGQKSGPVRTGLEEDMGPRAG